MGFYWNSGKNTLAYEFDGDDESIELSDRRTDPREGDVLYQANGTRELHVDKVCADEVCYRVTDGDGGLLAAYRTPLANWRESAPYTCDEIEMFCPSCDGRGDEYTVSPGGLFGKGGYIPCRMCNGSGRIKWEV